MDRKPLILCRPCPAGAAQEAEFFFYWPGEPNRTTAIARAQVPTVAAVDDGGNRYAIPRQNGWFVDFKPVGRLRQTWAVFAKDGVLYVEAADGLHRLCDGEISVSVRLFGFFARVSIKKCAGGPPTVSWVWFPWLRTWFIDGDTRPEECDPFCDIFSELSSEAGRQKWTTKWTSGLAVRNTAIRIAGDGPEQLRERAAR